MKKFTAFLLAAALTLSLAACAFLPSNNGKNPSSDSGNNSSDTKNPAGDPDGSNTDPDAGPAAGGDKDPDLSQPEDDPGTEPVIPPDDTPDPQPDDTPDPQPDADPIGSRNPDPSKPMVALTFDDGPHPEYTDQILDILEQYGAVATFFEVGQNLRNDPDAVRRAAAMGCEIGSHSMRHKDLSKLSSADLLADLQAADEQFISVLGKAPNLLRPPYGALNQRVKYETGRSIITWSVDTEDWLSLDADKVMATVKQAGNLDGDVILLHSTHAPSVEATGKLVPWLIEQGYQLVTITELITLHYGDQVLPNGTYGYSYFVNGKDVILPPEGYTPAA